MTLKPTRARCTIYVYTVIRLTHEPFPLVPEYSRTQKTKTTTQTPRALISPKHSITQSLIRRASNATGRLEAYHDLARPGDRARGRDVKCDRVMADCGGAPAGWIGAGLEGMT